MSATKEFNRIRADFAVRARAPELSANVFKLAHLIAYKYMDGKTEQTRYIGQDEIAADLNVTVRTVQNLLAILHPLGLLIEQGNGRGNASSYRIEDAPEAERTKPISSFTSTERAKSETPKGRNQRPERAKSETIKGEMGFAPSNKTLQEEDSKKESPRLSRASGAACDDPPLDMFGKEAKQASGCPKEASKASQQASEAFELFWAIYPRRAKKLAARRAWDKAVKTVTAEEIIEGARRYAREREDQPMKYTNHPATWLNGGGWMDDPGANVSHEQGYAEINAELYLRSDEENGLPPGTSEREAAAEHARAQTAWLDDIEARMAGVQR